MCALDAITTYGGSGGEIGAERLVVPRPHRGSARTGEQRFDLAANIGVSPRSLEHEHRTLRRRDLERRTIQLVDFRATFRSHTVVIARSTAFAAPRSPLRGESAAGCGVEGQRESRSE